MELLTLAPGSDRIPVELFQILKDDAVESAALNMHYALNMQYAGSRQQIDGETMGTVRNFIFFCSKITADGDCSHEIKRLLLLRRKAMTSLDSILKSRDMSLPTKVCIVKAMVFPVVMYGCER